MYESDLNGLRAALGSDIFAVEWAAGQAMALEDAIAEALEEVDDNRSIEQ